MAEHFPSHEDFLIDDLGIGPLGRNMAIWDIIIETEDDERTFCWICPVKVRRLEKTLYSGCLRARYCSQECSVSDWGVHGEWCEWRKGGEEGDYNGESQEAD